MSGLDFEHMQLVADILGKRERQDEPQELERLVKEASDEVGRVTAYYSKRLAELQTEYDVNVQRAEESLLECLEKYKRSKTE